MKNKNIFLTILSLLLGIATVNSQNYEWVKTFGTITDDVGFSITLDDSSNVYTTGYFSGTVDFDPGPKIVNLTSLGSSDIFVHKMDPLGNLIWARSYGTTNLDQSYAIDLDSNGNVYTAGRINFSTGQNGTEDFFVRKLDRSGNLLWSREFRSTASFNNCKAMSVDPFGNVYITGNFGGILDFDPGPGIANLNATSGRIYILKLDPFGNFLWVKSFIQTLPPPNSNNALVKSLVTDASGNIYTTGQFSASADFDPGAGTLILNSGAIANTFIQKLDSAGNFVWAKSFSSTNINSSESMSIDKLGNIYTIGNFRGTIDFDPGVGTFNLTSTGNSDFFIQKMDSSSNFIWAKSFGGSGWHRAESISIDTSGNVYSTGSFQGTVDFDPGASAANLTSAGNRDIFVQKLDPLGNFIWARSFGSNLDDFGNSIYIDSLESVFVTGSFFRTVDFDPGTRIVNRTAAGSADYFVLKLSDRVITSVLENDMEDDIQLNAFPNPSLEHFTVELGTIFENGEYFITDISGRLIQSATFKSSQILEFSLNEPAGIYFLTIVTENQKSVLKLIKK